MDNLGFIRDKLDIKILTLYILNRLPCPVDTDTLTELVLCDNGVNYFEFIEALSELMKTGHALAVDGKYAITPKGIRNSEEMESSLPYTVRLKAAEGAVRAARVLSRSAMVKTGHSLREDGSCTVSLSLSDGLGSILKLELLAGSEDQAKAMEKRFSKNAEGLYIRVAGLLLE